MPKLSKLIAVGLLLSLTTTSCLAQKSPSQKPSLASAQQSLWAAVKAKDNNAIKVALSNGANPNDFNNEAETPLIVAVTSGNIEAVRMLLNAGGNPTFKLGEFTSALNAAAVFGRLDMLKLFDQKLGAKLNWKNQSAAVGCAAARNQMEVLQYLLDKGAPLVAGVREKQPLEFSVAAGAIEGTKFLLKAGADPHKAKEPYYLPLLIAARQPEPLGVTMIRTLIEGGASPNGVDKHITPLGMAASAGRASNVRELLSLGADPNGQMYEFSFTAKPCSALRAVIRGGNQRLYTARTGIFGDQLPTEERSKLQTAAEIEDPDIVRALLEKGIDLRTGENRMAIIEAASAGNIGILKLLLEHGGDPNQVEIQEVEPSTPLSKSDLAKAMARQPDKAGAIRRDLFLQNLLPTGTTPLLAAASKGHAEVVKLLLQNGAKPGKVDEFRTTALMEVAGQGRTAIQLSLRQARLQASRNWNLAFTGYKKPELTEKEAVRLAKEAEQADTATILALIKAGTPVNALEDDGNSALMMSVRSSPAVVKTLLDAGAKVNQQNKSGETALMQVLQTGHRADPQQWMTPYNNDAAPLSPEDARARQRAIAADLNTMKLLLQQGARRDLKNRKGKTALQLAENLKYPEAVSLLKTWKS